MQCDHTMAMQILTHEWHKVTEDNKTSVLYSLTLLITYIHTYRHTYRNVYQMCVKCVCVFIQPMPMRFITQMVNCAIVLGDSKVSENVGMSVSTGTGCASVFLAPLSNWCCMHS